MPSRKTHTQVRLKPADSFDLIRLLARSQHDPRKAVCELVQNSLDAGARRIELTWFNDGGVRALRVWDDGQGIFPKLEREEALRRIAHTIGHSHKRSLTPQQRRELMLLGKYGIGLLGFWSVGVIMEIRSRVDGSPVWCLRLVEDNPKAEIYRVAVRRIDENPTYTQITIRGVHEGAQRQLRPSRLQLYLGSELRGQLVHRPETKLRLRDRVSRGRARKLFEVEPELFRGIRLQDLQSLEVPSWPSAQLELYLLPPESDQPGRVALACGGTTVLDSIAAIDGEDVARPPWDSGRIEGVVDFSDLAVAPGTRRGFQRDAAALAFLDALPALEAELNRRIADEDQRREEEEQEQLAKRIRQAFVSVAAALPEYDLFDIGTGPESEGAGRGEGGAPMSEAEGEGEREEGSAGGEGAEEDSAALFPPGPLAEVRVTPAKTRVPPGARKTLVARPVDRDGRKPRGTVSLIWRLDGPGELEPVDEARTVYSAPPRSASLSAVVTARQGLLEASNAVEIEVLEELLGREKASGIPEPQPVHAPLEAWRSRILNNEWQFNSAHRDYIKASESEAARLRYLIHLFAKELVLRNFGSPGDTAPLERMVEVLTHLGDARIMSRSRKNRT